MEKISKTLRIEIKDDYIYFNGDVFNTVGFEYDPEDPAKNFLIGKDSFIKSKYYFRGRYSCYIADFESNYGYKIFNCYYGGKVKLKQIQNIFNIQNILSEGGFAPKPYEIINCYDSKNSFYAIKMQNIKGKFVQPNQKWIDSFINFCKKNNITKDRVYLNAKWTLNLDKFAKITCVPKNCIEVEGKIYLVDIGINWKINK